jgi:hypothetical protein
MSLQEVVKFDTGNEVFRRPIPNEHAPGPFCQSHVVGHATQQIDDRTLPRHEVSIRVGLTPGIVVQKCQQQPIEFAILKLVSVQTFALKHAVTENAAVVDLNRKFRLRNTCKRLA